VAKEPNWDEIHPWFRETYGGGKFVAVPVKSPEFAAWLAFFRNEIGFVPQFMREATSETRPIDYAVTLPSKWPPNVQT
jgi:hypothetical protein